MCAECTVKLWYTFFLILIDFKIIDSVSDLTNDIRIKVTYSIFNWNNFVPRTSSACSGGTTQELGWA